MMAFVLIVLIIINAFTVYKFIFNMIFSDMDDFEESLRFSLTPDIISLFRGEYWKDQAGEIKLGFFIMLCIIATAMEYWLINGLVQVIIGVN